MPKYFPHIIFFSFLLMFLVLSPGCSQEQTKELSTITVSKQDEHEKKKSGLSLQFQDDFSKCGDAERSEIPSVGKEQLLVI